MLQLEVGVCNPWLLTNFSRHMQPTGQCMALITLVDRPYSTNGLMGKQRHELENKARYQKEAEGTGLCQGDR